MTELSRPLDAFPGCPAWLWSAWRMSYLSESIATAPDGMTALWMFLDELAGFVRGVSAEASKP